MIQIFRKLLLTSLIVAVSMPDLHLDNTLFSLIINDQIHTFPISCLCFYITITGAIDDRLEKQHKIFSSGIFQKCLILITIQRVKSLYKLLKHQSDMQMPVYDKLISLPRTFCINNAVLFSIIQ